AQTVGHAELMGSRLSRFAEQTLVIYSLSAERWFEVQHRSLTWTDGNKVRLQVARDITERREHEEESRLQQEKAQLTSRLTTMGEMASSLAHELNQPLTAISNYCMAAVAMVRSEQARPEQLVVALEQTAPQAERAGKIIRRIREIVKRSEPKRQIVSLLDILDNAVEFADIDKRNRQVPNQTQLTNHTQLVVADPSLIEQVLLNLLKNAIESMEKSDYHTLHVEVTLFNQYVEVAVIDRGCGRKDPERLFEPFYSTKSEGLGMGLNICRTIIESHHGRLWATSNPKGGTIFWYSLQGGMP